MSPLSSLLYRLCVTAALLVVVQPTNGSAQVGHMPQDSPYEDFQIGQTVTPMAGWVSMRRDPADVAVRSSAFGTLRYDIGIGGPTSFYARYLFAPSERRVLVPGNPKLTRVLGMRSTTTHLLDLGFDVSLTGRKTWHRLMPSLNVGIGVASDFAGADTGLYRFGTRFAFTYGGSLRILPRRGPQIRLDLSNLMWQYQYPDRYFVKASDTTAVLTNVRHRSAWRVNRGVSAGVSIPVFR